MRTTILLDDRLGERLRAQARREGKSFSAFLADAGRKALEFREVASTEPFQLITVHGEGTLEGINLDRTNELLVVADQAAYGGHTS